MLEGSNELCLEECLGGGVGGGGVVVLGPLCPIVHLYSTNVGEWNNRGKGEGRSKELRREGCRFEYSIGSP